MHHITPTAYEIQPSDKFQFGAMDSAVRPSTIIFINKVIRKVGKYFYTKYNIKSPDLWWWLQEVRVLHLCAYCRISLADLSGKNNKEKPFQKSPSYLPLSFKLMSMFQKMSSLICFLTFKIYFKWKFQKDTFFRLFYTNMEKTCECKYTTTQADLIIESYAYYKDQSDSEWLIITLL